ncbi:hypothetical protein ARMGADRAFT_1029499 [Armillaria gallica]|uniref:Uncharacterized protein n=1 Tax=Armillaria gallica TaxID=47427 RepID=A0A2H3DGM3_ARMGA|nr:hypothetical protein ARMGADRAFT_1029499 [Armillaria gallica]
MNDATAESLSLLELQSHQNNAVSELRRAMSSLRLVESYLNQGEILLRALKRLELQSMEPRPEIPQIQPTTTFNVAFHETNSPLISPLLLPSRRSSHNLLTATSDAPPRPPKSAHRRATNVLGYDTPSDEEDDQLSDLPQIQETKRARPLRRIRTRIPPPSITESLKAEIEAAGLSIHQGEPAPVRPAPSSPTVKSTMFLVIEDGVATRHQLSNPLTRNKHQAQKEKSVLRRVVHWVLRRDV